MLIVKSYIFCILFCFFFELIGTDTAQGAFVILGQLVTLINITTNVTYEFLHAVSPLFNKFVEQSRHRPVKLS